MDFVANNLKVIIFSKPDHCGDRKNPFDVEFHSTVGIMVPTRFASVMFLLGEDFVANSVMVTGLVFWEKCPHPKTVTLDFKVGLKQCKSQIKNHKKVLNWLMCS